MNNNYQKNQQGAALVISLIILIVLTLLGLSTMTSSTLDLKIAANSRDYHNSFKAAYSGIETAISDSTIDYTENTTVVGTTTLTTKDYDYLGTGDKAKSSTNVIVGAASRVLSVQTIGNTISGAAGDFLVREIESTGTSGTARSRQIQGVRHRVTSNN